jgi:hypothetical protein
MKLLIMWKNKHRSNHLNELYHVNHYRLGVKLIVRQGNFVDPLRNQLCRFAKKPLIAEIEKDSKAECVERVHVSGSR